MRFTKDDPDRHVLILVVLGMEFFTNNQFKHLTVSFFPLDARTFFEHQKHINNDII